MVFRETGKPLRLEEVPLPSPGFGELRVRVEACAVCRTDLHIVDGELSCPRLPLIPGHEIVGVVDVLGDGVTGFAAGERVGIPWLGHTCGHCPYCTSGHENLCDRPVFTGYSLQARGLRRPEWRSAREKSGAQIRDALTTARAPPFETTTPQRSSTGSLMS